MRNPWFDRDVLDYSLRVPFEARFERCMYRDALAQLSPTFRGFERGSLMGYMPDWNRIVIRGEAALRSWIESFDSRLDEIIPPAFGHAVLDEITGLRSVRWTLPWLVHASHGVAARLPGVPKRRTLIPIVSLFRRWAILRASLRE